MKKLPCGHTEGTEKVLMEPEDWGDAPFKREVCRKKDCQRWVGDTPLPSPQGVLAI